ENLDHVPTLVAVGLGGATGPAPKAILDQGAQEFADVPIPSWRPDRTAPAGTGPKNAGSAAQGDQPVKVAN
ncbi:D-alanyl-D-alanine carboxypeptidase, partial [Mesorhizobium sp. M7A.F.Ca.CA.002.15.2.1]